MLTSEKIDAILREIQGYEADVLRLYWDYVPVGSYSEAEKLEYIIAGASCASELPAGAIARSLRRPRPSWGSYSNAPENKPELVHSWASAYPDHVSLVAEFMSGQKDIPSRLKMNKEWLCLLAVDNVVDWANSIHQWPYDGDVTLEMFDKLIVDFVNGFC